MYTLLLLLCPLAAYFLWRDFQLGRIYRVYKNKWRSKVSLDFRAREFYETRRSLSIFFEWILRTLTVMTILGSLLSISAFFLPAWVIASNEYFLLTGVCFAFLFAYVFHGAAGRLLSYIKNYGSVHKTW